MTSPDHRHFPFPLDPSTRISAEMGAIVSWPGTCQHGAVNRHRGTPGGNVFDRAAGTYRTVGPDFFGYFGRRLVDRIGIPRGGRVVDLACGTGAALVPAAEAVGARGLSVGLDLSVAMLRRAGATDAGSGPQLRLACMDATHLAIRSESFDAVVCSFALGSFPDPLSALAECWRVAHPGGRLGLVVSDRWWWEGDERWSWHGDLLQAIGVPVPVTRFASAEAIDSVLKEAGWELRDLVTELFPWSFRARTSGGHGLGHTAIARSSRAWVPPSSRSTGPNASANCNSTASRFSAGSRRLSSAPPAPDAERNPGDEPLPTTARSEPSGGCFARCRALSVVAGR
jgi:SAM-dependent methyltransferase